MPKPIDKFELFEQVGMPSTRLTYTVKEISILLRISLASAYALLKSKEFNTVRIGRSIRVSKASFDKWLEFGLEGSSE
jgi:excisionase family DNA binding protein